MKLIVGLGNPGTKYARNRHNVGFMVVDHLQAQLGLPAFREKFSGEFTKGLVGQDDIVLLKPQTFMNESGRSVQPAVGFFHASVKGPEPELLVVHDELDLAFGDVRLKVAGGHAGHNGLRSIIGILGADFARVRVGIGRPPEGFRGEVADFVLQNFDGVEAAECSDLVARASGAVRRWLDQGALAAMNETNTKTKKAAKGATP